MAVKRNKPAIGVTLDADVMEWITREATAMRLSASAFVNGVLAKAMKESIGECSARPCATQARGRRAS